MDPIIPGRIQTALPRLVEGLRQASQAGDPTASKNLLSMIHGAASSSAAVPALATRGMAAAGSISPPPAPDTPPSSRSGPERFQSLAVRARELAEGVNEGSGEGGDASVGRLGDALDLLSATAREQQALMQRSLRDLR